MGQHWAQKIQAGWRPTRHIRILGYDESAEFYGIYLWEYFHVFDPLLTLLMDTDAEREHREECASCMEQWQWGQSELRQWAGRYQIDLEALRATRS